VQGSLAVLAMSEDADADGFQKLAESIEAAPPLNTFNDTVTSCNTVDPCAGRCHASVMNSFCTIGFASFCLITTTGFAAMSGSAFYGDPPDDKHPWAVHDRNRPQPKVVTPGAFSSVEQPGKPPSDAVVLFDGSDLSKWESTKQGKPVEWLVKDGYMQTTATGDLRTKDQFGDCQLHVEWAAPTEVKGDSQGRGNSGIFLMGRVEIQVLDCYNNPTYADGGAGSVYGVNPPMANALRPPGEFQVYDIVFRRPVYKDGQMIDPGYVTVLVNGVLVQDHTPLEGPTGHMGRSKPAPFPAKGPLQLQDHGNPVRFRNIWYRDLPPRSIEGGTDGCLPLEVTLAKRKETAAAIRQDASQMSNPDNPRPQMLRLMESLVYENEPTAAQQAQAMAAQYTVSVKSLAADQLKSKKDEILNVNGALQFLVKSKVLSADFGPKLDLEKIIKDQGWDKKR
jgi:hypothetical protein